MTRKYYPEDNCARLISDAIKVIARDQNHVENGEKVKQKLGEVLKLLGKQQQ